MFVLRTLGELSLTRVDQPEEGLVTHAKALLILALLATSARLTGRRDHLAELLWPDSDNGRARRSLRQALFHLSRQAGDVLKKDGDHLTLNRDILRVDIWDFEEAMKREDYTAAIDVHRGHFLAGQERKVGPELEHWIESQNSRIRSHLELAYTADINSSIARDQTGRAAALARRYVQLDPMDETAQTLLVRALRADGDEVAALGSFQEYKTLVETELGETPTADWQARMGRVREELLRVPEPLAPAGSTSARVSDPQLAWAGADSQPRHRVRWAILPAAVVVAMGAIGVVAKSNLGSEPAGSLSELSGRVLVNIDRGTDTVSADVVLNGQGVDVEIRENLTASDVPSPDGQWIAFSEAAPDGWNLAVRKLESRESRQLTQAAQDEYPLRWSPDGRYLVYARRRLRAGGRSYTHDVRLFDLATGTARRLTQLVSREQPSAAWSPDGTQLLFTADDGGSPDIFRMGFDGENLSNITKNPDRDAEPAWSPDRKRVAFVARRGGTVDLVTTRPDGTDLRPITNSEARESQPVWLTPTIVLFLVRHEDGGDLWAVDTFNGQTRQLTRRGDIIGLRMNIATPAQPTWIEKVAITPRPRLASPGQHIALRAELLNAADSMLATDGLPIQWTVTNREIARFTDDGYLQFLATGETEVVASVGGWRVDTLRISSAPLTEYPVPPIVTEDWRGGLQPEKWLVFGEPTPGTAETGAPDGGVFLNSGDAFFESGALLQIPVSLARGMTVESFGKMPFTGQLHQTFGMALHTSLTDDSLETGNARPLVDFRIQGPTADEPASAWVTTRENRDAMPIPTAPNSWHLYALQIQPDGIIEVIVDGRVHWRSDYRLDLTGVASSGVYVGLGFRSYQTKISHGPLAVYGQPKYQLPTLPPAPTPFDSFPTSPTG